MHRAQLYDQPQGMFRGNELMRLLTMITFLAVLAMIIVRARDPNTWSWFTGEGQQRPAAAEPPREQPVVLMQAPDEQPAPLVAGGPTDEDPDEADAIKEEFQAVTDGTLETLPEEMVAYKRVVRWVANQPYVVLERRGTKGWLFRDFYQKPANRRGRIAVLDLNIRRILKVDEPVEGHTLYEVWGFTTESQAWLYNAVVIDLPPGMPTGPNVEERARLVGYFFKLQGYHEAGAKPHAPPLKSPFFIGRLQWTPAVQPPVQTADWAWTFGLLGLFAAVILVRCVLLFVGGRRRTQRPPVSFRAPSKSPDEIRDWLERAGPVDIGDDAAGNNSEESHESGNGKPRGAGQMDWPPGHAAGDIDDLPSRNP